MNTLVEEFKSQADYVVQGFKKEAAGIRTNRPTAALVEDIKVDYYGEFLPLKQVGSISIVPPREIVVQVWDKAATANVAKAIESTSAGLTAHIEGNIVRIHLPELNSERREELIKYAKSVAEKYRIQLRHLRDEVNKKIQKSFNEDEITEDQKFKFKEEVQKETDKINKRLDEVLESKIREIRE